MVSIFPYSEILSVLGPIVLLYPEIHYVFKYIPFSRYRRKVPEIIADAPYRVEPGQALPVLLIIKDADLFPVTIESVALTWHNAHASEAKTLTVKEDIRSKWWHRIFTLDIQENWRGAELEVNVEVHGTVRGEKIKISNDNLPGLSHRPFKVYAASEKLPGLAGWVQGDIHFHTDYTSDQIEFGAPLKATAKIAQAVGLQFFAATDHSYDLDDLEDNFLKNDPELRKWKRLHEEIDQLNQEKGTPVILPGEEVSCANAEGKNVHCLVLNNRKFLPGSGDGAEKWFKTDAELSINEVVKNSDPEALIIAAHPKDPAPWLEKILLRRGRWSGEDCRTKGLAGLQILNGLDNAAFYEGLEQWRRLLLKGEKVFIYAGNDAHGDFNRFRQVKIFMWSLYEIERHRPFGWARTCVRTGSDPVNNETLTAHLRQGHAVITNGPIAALSVKNQAGSVFEIGSCLPDRSVLCTVEARTTAEMGDFSSIRIWLGEVSGKEILIKEMSGESHVIVNGLEVRTQGLSYLRCEARTVRGLFCYTNPIWIGCN